MSKNFFVFCFIFQLIKTQTIPQNEISTNEYEACKMQQISKLITACKGGKRNVFFYYNTKCNTRAPSSLKLPAPLIGVDCMVCGKGKFLEYDFTESSLFCGTCPANTFSLGGNFRIEGQLKEWTNDNPFWNYLIKRCYIVARDGKELSANVDCTNWEPENDNSYIKSGSPAQLTALQYFANLILSINAARKGKISFRYKNDPGVFRFYINYVMEIEDNIRTKGWKEVSFTVEPGYNTFLWEYEKEIISEELMSAALKIKSIEVEGMETADFECKNCLNSSSEIGSYQCEFCQAGSYFNEETYKCQECPSGTYSTHNSVGLSSCQKIPKCTEQDYNEIISPFCNKSNNLQIVTYELKASSKCMHISLPSEKEIDCIPCFKGQYVKEFNETHTQCSYCEENSYSNTLNSASCIPCSDGLLSKTLVITNFSDVNNMSLLFDMNVKIVREYGTVIVNYSLTNMVDPSKDESLNLQFDEDHNYEILSQNGTEVHMMIPSGDHRIRLEYINSKAFTKPKVQLNSIQIHNSSEGGGYECTRCETGEAVEQNGKKVCSICGEGMEISDTGICSPCEKGYYKRGTNNRERCKLCPAFTRPNQDQTNCILNEVLTHSKYTIRHVLTLLEESQISLCEINDNLCSGDFYGPMRDKEKNIYFISYKVASLINPTEFSYFRREYFHDKGFVYALLNDNKTKGLTNNTHENKKILVNLGSQIEYAKILSLDRRRGVIVKYSEGETCMEDPSKNYTSFLFIQCYNSLTNTDDEYSAPRFFMKDKCDHVFVWTSKAGCPVCLKTEVSSITMPCKMTQRVVYFTETSQCIITDAAGKEGALDEHSDDFLVINNSQNTSDIDILSYLNLTHGSTRQLEEISIINNTSPYVSHSQETEFCMMYEDYDQEILYFLIGIPIIYIIVMCLCIYCCCKYRKIKNEYHRLVEDGGTITEQENKNHQQLELGSSHLSQQGKASIQVPSNKI